MSNKANEPEKTSTRPVKQARKWNFGNVFWGLLIILVGTLLLLKNFNIISVNLLDLWRLWPVLIIGLGLSMLSLRGWLGALVSFIASILLLGLVALTIIDNPIYPGIISPNVQTTTQSESAGDAKSLQVTVEAGAANITLGSSQQQRGVKTVQESNQPNLTKSSTMVNDSHHIIFSTKDPQTPWFGNVTNNITTTLTESIPIDIILQTGATSISGDLSRVKLSSLAIKTGASDIDLRLGLAQEKQSINISAGASDVTLRAPKQAGVQIKSQSTLANTHFEGVDKKSDSLYESANFNEAKTKIIIEAELGVSQFTVKRY